MPLFFVSIKFMIYFSLIILGLAFGSFVNALVWRTYQSRSKQNKNLSVWTGRSMCTNCKTTLQWRDLIPVLSWLSLNGRCRYCGKKIDDTPLVELLVPLLFLASYIFWPMSFDGWLSVVIFSVWLVIVITFVAMFVYDLRWMILPDKYTVFFSCLAVLFIIFLAINQSDLRIITGSVFGAITISGIFYILYRISKGGWIGGGDVKLGVGLGLLAGSPVLAFMLIFIASIIGSIISLPAMFSKKLSLTDKIPFGPLLITAAILVVLFGSALLDWYINNLLLIDV